MPNNGNLPGRRPTVTPAILAMLPKVREAGGLEVTLKVYPSQSGAHKAARRLAAEPAAAGFAFRGVKFPSADGRGSELRARYKGPN